MRNIPLITTLLIRSNWLAFKGFATHHAISQKLSKNKVSLGSPFLTGVHVVLGSRLRPCKPSALDLTIANTWVRSSN